MPTSPMSEILKYLRGARLPEGADLTDGQLLESFVSRRKTAALEDLVQRYGPMVWGGGSVAVCSSTTTTPRTPFSPPYLNQVGAC